MRKILISIMLVIFIILAYLAVAKNISIFGWESKNLSQVKQANDELDSSIMYAKELKTQEAQKIEELNTSINMLKAAKEQYEKKMEYVSNDIDIGIIKSKEYKIERLWIALENYAKDENVKLKLDILDTEESNVYDLDIEAVGSYIGITDFIYDIEKDDTLGFKILNFKLVPNVTEVVVNTQNNNNESQNSNTTNTNNNTSSTQTVTKKIENLKATFKIESVKIEFN